MQLAAEEVGRLFEAFVEEAFTEMVFVNQPGRPDELHFSLELRNAAGQSHALGKFASVEHRRFERILDRVVTTIAGHFTAKVRKQLTLP